MNPSSIDWTVSLQKNLLTASVIRLTNQLAFYSYGKFMNFLFLVTEHKHLSPNIVLCQNISYISLLYPTFISLNIKYQ